MTTLLRLTDKETLRQAFDIQSEVDKALVRSRGEFTALDILGRVADGTAQVYLAEGREGERQATLVTEVIDYPQGSALRVITLTGKDLRSWRNDLDWALMNLAEAMHCRWIEFAGREGFEKALEGLGYEKVYTVYSKELPDE